MVGSKEKEGPIEKVRFPIIGIGSSAGGLEALERFFSNIPSDIGMAFVLIPHLDPNFKSQLSELIMRHAQMEVSEVVDNDKIKPNHAYIIPPNKNLAIDNGRLITSEPHNPRGMRLPIDFFFRSLALQQKENAICIILSGTGTDGTFGLREVKGVGGMVMAQEPKTAKYAGMPESAINSNLVDYILPPEDMSNQLIKYVNQSFANKDFLKEKDREYKDANLLEIYKILQSFMGFNYTAYKKNTIIRRIEKRITVTQSKSIKSYLELLKKNTKEIEILFQEVLIGVTNFFRDKEAFNILKSKVLPDLFNERTLNQPLRIWIPACSTGEEAYTIAILTQEYLENAKINQKYQIFATDLCSQSIEKARQAVYPDNISLDIDTNLISKYFIANDKNLEVKKIIRDKIVFAQQNLITDPPFSNVDLICCRNLLIYLVPKIQKKILLLFHYSLKPDGFLFLGSSESISSVDQYFKNIDTKWKIFQKINLLVTNTERERSFPPLVDYHKTSQARDITTSSEKKSYNQLMVKYLISEYTPCGVIINNKNDILYFHGHTGKFLEHAEGDPKLNILEMAKEGFRLQLSSAIRRARSKKETVQMQKLKVRSNTRNMLFNLIVEPIIEPNLMESLLIILFEEITEETSDQMEDWSAEVDVLTQKRINQLESELASTKHQLQTTIEELETSNEELKSTNEELQSSNEELQSTNEELQTSKEELQSVNEELLTTNAELERNILNLTQAENDISNLISSTDIGIMFLDMDLLIKRFTSPIVKCFNVIKSDIGRPLHQISTNLKYNSIMKDIEQVKNELVQKSLDIQDTSNNWYLIEIKPYNTSKDTIKGVVISVLDITDRKRKEKELRRLANVMTDSNDAMTIQDLTGKVLTWNKGAELIYGYTKQETVGKHINFIIPYDYREEYKELLKKVQNVGNIRAYETIRRTKNNENLNILLTITQISDENKNIIGFATTERDITKYKKAIEVHFYKDLFAHDMNNILQALSLFVDYFSTFKNDKEKLEKIQDLIENIKIQLYKGRRLIENVQILSNLEEMDIILEAVPIKNVLSNSVNNVITTFQDRTVRISVEGLFKGAKVYGNRLLIEVFDNLLNNAVKYDNNRKEVLIEIQISRSTKNKTNYIKFEFKDHGIGVMDSFKDFIFRRFQKTNLPDKKGMGIGLSLVKKIIDIYEGEIWVEDRIKGDYTKGSNFILLLKEA